MPSAQRSSTPLALLPVILCGLGAVLLPACTSGPPELEGSETLNPDATFAHAMGERIDIPMGPAFREIALLEDQRTLGTLVEGTPRLLHLLADEDPQVRARAALALGRFEYPNFGSRVTDALGRGLGDADQSVRQAAAFALGQRRDPQAAASLRAYLQDPSPRMRARVVEAAAKLEGEQLHADLALALRDADPSVRIEAADGTVLWSRSESNAAEIDRELLDALIPRDEQGLPLSPDATALELRWHLLHALARRNAPSGRGVFLERLGSRAALDRLFAAMGLARTAAEPDADTGIADAAATAALGALLTGAEERSPEPDWRVAVEACHALGNLGDAAALGPLVGAANNKSVHVRIAAMGALAKLRVPDNKVLVALHRAQLDLSRGVRAAALQALVQRSKPEQGLGLVLPSAHSDDYIERGLAATTAGLIDTPEATALLQSLVNDQAHFVATRAAESIGAQNLERVRPLLHEYLKHPDNGVRLAAVMGLARNPVEADAPGLIEAFRTSTGEISGEVAFNALRALAQAGGPLARAIHLEAVRDPRPHVRRVAVEGLEGTFGQRITPAEPGPLDIQGEVALPGRDYPRWTHNPLVEIVTTKGVLLFELLPAEAPAHVHSFLELAQTGFYDGLIFHRVVADFVVQGGDMRGDGNGGKPVRGSDLRGEFTSRSYRRGALGMPRNEDPDSGGSQIFVTHRPTPHLDSRYTLFGLLLEGGEVLDTLELGDRILRIAMRN